MEDKAIIALFFARSERAIEELNGKYGKVFTALANRILNDPQDAEECVSDAYLGAWNTIPPQNPDPLLTYVCRILRNRCIARYHANTAQKRNSVYDVALEELEETLASSSRVEETLETRELTALIQRFLDRQSREDRVIFLRRYYYAEPYGEIAKRVGLTEKNVSVRLSRIRGKLRSFLKEKEVIA